MKKAIKRVVSFVLALMLLLGGGVGLRVTAATTDELQKQIDELKEQESDISSQIRELEDRMEENVQEITEISNQKRNIDQQIFLLQEQIDNTEEQISVYSALIADTQEELDAAEERLFELRQKNKVRIRAMEEEGEINYWSILFRANSFSDLLDRLDMIREIAAADQRRLQELRDAKVEVERVQSELETQKAELQQTRKAQEDQQQALQEKRADADALLQELLAKGEEFEFLMEEAELEEERLLAELAQVEQEYDEAAYREWLASQPVSGNTGENGASAGDTQWLTPVPWYVLTSKFGMRLHPKLNIWRMHNGVDLACSLNTPIYASRSGVVTIAQEGETAGFYVQINHGDGYRSIYMHMNYFIVSVGEYVTAGQTIGYVGSTGLSTGNHLHFGISYNGTYVDPMEYIG